MITLENHTIGWMVNINVHLRKNRYYKTIQKTLTVIFPFVLLGTFITAIDSAFFTTNGFFNQIYHISSWLPYFSSIHIFFEAIRAVTTELIALLIAYFSAKYLARSYHRDDQLTGLTSLACYLLISFDFLPSDPIYFFHEDLGLRGILLGFVVGLVIAFLYNLISRHHHHTVDDQPIAVMTRRALYGIIPMSVLIISVAIISYAIYLMNWGSLSTLFYTLFRIPVKKLHFEILIILALSAISNLMWTIGVAGPLSLAAQGIGTNQNTANLNYALTHGSTSGVPYPISMHTIYETFGNFGGNGMTFGLIIAILVASNSKNFRQIANLSLIPSLVNMNMPMLIGLPILFNPIMMIPFILAPIVSMIIGYLFIKTGAMPPAVYMVPSTTPALLMGFFGTNGNWVSLLASTLCLASSVLVYLPFVRIMTQVSNQLTEKEVLSNEI